MKEVGMEWNLPLEDDKHERLVLGCPLGRKKRKGKEGRGQKWVKWLGIIFDEDLNFDQHWHRIAAARRLLGAIGGVGNSKCGMSPRSWRQAYTGMVRVVASWGSELGWRGQKRWEIEMDRLQYDALRKCTGAVRGAAKEKVRKIAGVETVRTFLDAKQAGFIARVMRNPELTEGVWKNGIANAPRVEGTHEEFQT